MGAPFHYAMKFGTFNDLLALKFCYSDQEEKEGEKFNTYWNWTLEKKPGYITEKEDEYLTVTYRVVNNPEDTYDGIEYVEGYDEIIFFKNGVRYGYAYYAHSVYEEGRNTWDNDETPFFIGACPWNGDNKIYYLDGIVYCVRLYERVLTPTEVTDNYKQTLKYRDKTQDL